MTGEEITQYLTELNDELRLVDIKGEVSLFGGAVMVLAFNARVSTRDIDAVFEPVTEIRNAAHRIADRHNLNLDWLNHAVKMFVVKHKRDLLFELSNIRVTVPEPDYLLAMKILALRPETEDENDATFLIEHLKITSKDDVLKIVADYYPKKEVSTRTRVWLDEFFDE
jgi:DNA-directed RNA polymerase subunit F